MMLKWKGVGTKEIDIFLRSNAGRVDDEYRLYTICEMARAFLRSHESLLDPAMMVYNEEKKKAEETR